MSINKKQIYVGVAILAIAVFVAGTVIFNVQPATANLHTNATIDFTGNVQENTIVMKKGETKVIPMSIMSPKEKTYNLKSGITAAGNETIFALTDKQDMPKGIFAKVDKSFMSLQATTEKGIAQRDTVNITISVDPNTETGVYPLSFVLSQDLGNGLSSQATTYLYIDVQ